MAQLIFDYKDVPHSAEKIKKFVKTNHRNNASTFYNIYFSLVEILYSGMQ